MLKKAVKDNPTVDWSLAVSNWTNTHESALISSVVSLCEDTGNKSFSKIKNWADTSPTVSTPVGTAYQLLGVFSTDRSSFELDETSL